MNEISVSRLKRTLHRIAWIPVAAVVTVSLLAIGWNIYEGRQKSVLAYEGFISELIKAQQSLFALEIYLNQEEAVSLRLELIARSQPLATPTLSTCIRITPLNVSDLKPLNTYSVCSKPGMDYDWSSSKTIRTQMIQGVSEPIARIEYASIKEFAWNELLPLRMLLATMMTILGAFLLQRYLVRKLELNILAPLLDQITKDERNRALAEAVQMMAHDLKQPFAVLRFVINSLHRTNDRADFESLRDKLLPEIDAAHSRVTSMLSDVMDIGSNSKGTSEEVLISPLIVQAIKESRDLHPNVNPRVELTLGHQHAVTFDPRNLRRVLSNLVDNAFQAVESDGKIWICSRAITAGEMNFIEFTIGNNGPAIPEEDQLKIFELFYTTKKTGTGLGLAITKKFIVEHGGEITCKSNREVGTEFLIKFPCTANATPHTTSNATEISHIPSEKGLIAKSSEEEQSLVLLFDDENIVHEVWRRSGENEGIKFAHYRSWEDFANSQDFFAKHFTTAFVDLNYRGSKFDGSDIAKNLKQLGVEAVYAITADVESALRCKHFQEVRGKEFPLDIRQLIRTKK